MSAPALKELPSSPLQKGAYGANTKAPSTLRALFQNKHVLNSMKWGFCSATFITFHTLYHTRGNIPLAMFFGGMAFCVVSPIKFYVYMNRQRWEFFRSLQFAAQNNETNILGTSSNKKKIASREALYNPNEPYSDEEWAFAQQIYRRTIYYSVGGACCGGMGSAAVLSLMNVARVSPMWMRFGFGLSVTLFGAGLGFRTNMNWAINQATKWEKDGRLKQELKYVIDWMNADKAEKAQRPDPNNRRPQKI